MGGGGVFKMRADACMGGGGRGLACTRILALKRLWKTIENGPFQADILYKFSLIRSLMLEMKASANCKFNSIKHQNVA